MSSVNTTTPESGVSTVTGNKDELIRSVALILGVIAAVVAVVVGAVWVSCCILVPREEREARLRHARQRKAIQRRLTRDLGIEPMDVLGEGDVPRPAVKAQAHPGISMDDLVRLIEEEYIEIGIVGLGIRSPLPRPEPEIRTIAGPSRPPATRVR